MKKYRFKKMDAFASGSSTGNPAAAVYPDSFEDIADREMQQIARELKGFVSEVGFIAKAGPDRYKLRYFSAEKEVEFCGHATIAIMYDLLKNDAERAGCGCCLAVQRSPGLTGITTLPERKKRVFELDHYT